MSTAYVDSGRAAQKRRTRQALVDAARELVAAGKSPTVEDAAAAASISRTTAYRYFSSQRDLLLAAHPEVGATTMLPPRPPADPHARLDLMLRNYMAMVLETETQQRTTLRISLEVPAQERDALPLRQGRAIKWIGEALEPLQGRLSETQLHRLILAIRATTGIEALVWLTDVAGLLRADAVKLMRWSAHSLLDAALEKPPPTR
ncbi:MAG TPA: helix-turn-helix domain-containing protein [Acidimicrobiales bacterium]